MLWSDPAAVILNAQSNKISKTAWAFLRIRLQNFHRLQSEGDLPPIRHRIARIDCQIEKNLFDHPSIRFDEHTLRQQLRLNRDRFRNQAAKHFHHSDNHFIEINRFKPHRLLSAKSQ